MDGEEPYSPLKKLYLDSVRNGETLRSIREGVMMPSSQIDDPAEVDLRAASLEAIAVG